MKFHVHVHVHVHVHAFGGSRVVTRGHTDEGKLGGTFLQLFISIAPEIIIQLKESILFSHNISTQTPQFL
jgi:hypothetical protein